MGDKLLSAQDVVNLANIPPKQVLISQLVGQLAVRCIRYILCSVHHCEVLHMYCKPGFGRWKEGRVRGNRVSRGGSRLGL